MNWKFRLRGMLAFSRHVPWVEPVKWLREDAIATKTFLSSATGRKFSDYMTNFVLRQQAEALISPTNLKHKAGFSVGAKAILTHIEALSEVDNFTDEEGSD